MLDKVSGAVIHFLQVLASRITPPRVLESPVTCPWSREGKSEDLDHPPASLILVALSSPSIEATQERPSSGARWPCGPFNKSWCHF